VIFVPFYEHMALDDLFKFAATMPEIAPYLCEDRDKHRLPRAWVCNVIFTRVGERFSAWVDNHIDLRNEKLAEAQKLNIEMDSDIFDAFQSSTQISSTRHTHLAFTQSLITLFLFVTASKGISAHLLKIGSKRKRTKQEI
jgi:hypothetical protein